MEISAIGFLLGAVDLFPSVLPVEEFLRITRVWFLVLGFPVEELLRCDGLRGVEFLGQSFGDRHCVVAETVLVVFVGCDESDFRFDGGVHRLLLFQFFPDLDCCFEIFDELMVCGVGQAHGVVLVLAVRVDAHAQQVGYLVFGFSC